MNFKHIVLGAIAALLLALTFTGCQREEIIPDDVQSFYVITTPYINRDSVFDGGERLIFRPVGGVVSFLDASRGVVSRSWFVEGGDVLEKDNDQLVEGDSLIQVQFNEPGFYNVRLVASLDSTDLLYYDTVNDTVKDADGIPLLDSEGNDSVRCVNCVLVPFVPPGSLDTTFTVQVFDSIQADFTAEQEGVVGETFEAGIPVTFKDNSKGTPYYWRWTFAGAEPDEFEGEWEDSVDVIWKKSGTYRVIMRPSRPYLEGDINQDADFIMKEVTITPSTAPLEFLSVSASANGEELDVSFNQPLVELPAIGEFAVEADGVTYDLFNTEFPNSEDSSVVRVILSTPLPASSIYTLTSTLNIKADGKTLASPIDASEYFKGEDNLFPEGFGDMEGVTSVGVSVVPNTSRGAINGLFTSGQINSDGEPNGSETYWKRPWPFREDLTLMTEAEEAPENVLAGTYSCKWSPGVGNQLDQNPTRGPSFDLTEGANYEVVAWVKAEGGTGKVNLIVRQGTAAAIVSANGVAIPEGEWTRVTVPYTGAEGGFHNLRFVNTATDDVVYYIDEVSVFAK